MIFCCSKFSVIYPFLHIAPDPQEMLQIGSIPSSVIADYEIQSMLKGLYWYIVQTLNKLIISIQPSDQLSYGYSFIIGAYKTIDMVECMPDIWSRSGYHSTKNKRDIFSTGHIIFNGLKVNDNPKPKRLQALGKFCQTISIFVSFLKY